MFSRASVASALVLVSIPAVALGGVADAAVIFTSMVSNPSTWWRHLKSTTGRLAGRPSRVSNATDNDHVAIGSPTSNSASPSRCLQDAHCWPDPRCEGSAVSCRRMAPRKVDVKTEKRATRTKVFRDASSHVVLKQRKSAGSPWWNPRFPLAG